MNKSNNPNAEDFARASEAMEIDDHVETLNNTTDSLVPPEMRQSIVDAIQTATGRTVNY